MAYLNADIKKRLTAAFLGAAVAAPLLGPVAVFAAPEFLPWHLKNPQTRGKESVDMNIVPLGGAVTGKKCLVTLVEPMPQDPKTGKTMNWHAPIVGTMINGPNGIAGGAQVDFLDADKTHDLAGVAKSDVLNFSMEAEAYGGSRTALQYANLYSAAGRKGLGMLMFTAAGNNGIPHYEYEKLRSDVMAIGSINKEGRVASHSAKGSYTYLIAPGENILHERRVHTGTSLASPLTAGIGCLMLEANPGLYRRDVQDILALTARPHLVNGGSFRRNAAKDANGGGYRFQNGAGFGLIDAYAAVRLAETWTPQADAKTAIVLSTRNVAGMTQNHAALTEISHPTPLLADHVRLTFSGLEFKDGKTIRPQDVRIVLTSPSGTSVDIFTPVDTQKRSHTSSTPYFRGESVNGGWTVSLHGSAGTEIRMADWSLEITARHQPQNHHYVFTNAFRTGEQPLTLKEPGIINTTPIRGAVRLDLDGEKLSSIAGGKLEITPKAIHTAYTGDGNDTIRGSLQGSRIMAGRGDDTIIATGGKNIYVYRPGIDGNDTIIQSPAATGTLLLRNTLNQKADPVITRNGNDLTIQFTGQSGRVVVRNADRNFRVIPEAGLGNSAERGRVAVQPAALPHLTLRP